jgi:hypothetical protein
VTEGIAARQSGVGILAAALIDGWAGDAVSGWVVHCWRR